MRQVKISDLRAHLSEYLAKVRRGATVVVLCRNTPIARLVPFLEGSGGLQVRRARRPPSDLKKVRGVRLRQPVDIVKLLRADRDQR